MPTMPEEPPIPLTLRERVRDVVAAGIVVNAAIHDIIRAALASGTGESGRASADCPHGFDPKACWACTPPSEDDY